MEREIGFIPWVLILLGCGGGCVDAPTEWYGVGVQTHNRATATVYAQKDYWRYLFWDEKGHIDRVKKYALHYKIDESRTWASYEGRRQMGADSKVGRPPQVEAFPIRGGSHASMQPGTLVSLPPGYYEVRRAETKTGSVVVAVNENPKSGAFHAVQPLRGWRVVGDDLEGAAFIETDLLPVEWNVDEHCLLFAGYSFVHHLPRPDTVPKTIEPYLLLVWNYQMGVARFHAFAVARDVSSGKDGMATRSSSRP